MHRDDEGKHLRILGSPFVVIGLGAGTPHRLPTRTPR